MLGRNASEKRSQTHNIGPLLQHELPQHFLVCDLVYQTIQWQFNIQSHTLFVVV